MRLSIATLAVLAACSPQKDPAPVPPARPSATASPHTPGFDAQAWLAEAREVAVGVQGAEVDDPGTGRMKELAARLNGAADWRRACDTYLDYDSNEEIYEPTPAGGGHWVRGTMEIGDVSETEAFVAVTCDFGAYQGSYALVYIAGDRVALLSSPNLDDGGLPTDLRFTTFSTPDFSRVENGIVGTFARARGLGDCGLYTVYALGDDDLTVREIRERDCSNDIPDDLPPPSQWPVVYSAD